MNLLNFTFARKSRMSQCRVIVKHPKLWLNWKKRTKKIMKTWIYMNKNRRAMKITLLPDPCVRCRRKNRVFVKTSPELSSHVETHLYFAVDTFTKCFLHNKLTRRTKNVIWWCRNSRYFCSRMSEKLHNLVTEDTLEENFLS